LKRKEKQRKREMSNDDLIRHLADLEAHFQALQNPSDPDPINEADLKAMQEAQDALYDYQLMSQQYSAMLRKYEAQHTPISASGVYVCPECHHRVREFCNHCQHCGTMIGWDQIGMPKRRRAGK